MRGQEKNAADYGERDQSEDLIDARIISLYSQDTQLLPQDLDQSSWISGRNRYRMFCYYDAISVQEVKGNEPLKAAYQTATAEDETDRKGFYQVMLAFTDITSIEDQWGYTQTNIDEFWDNDKYPIFFMTMLNIGDEDNPENMLKRIDVLFSGKHIPRSRYLTYLTFDHCDILIFYRGSNFQEYSLLIFLLNYNRKMDEDTKLLTDSITFYSFASQYKEELPEDETFGVLLRVGVIDYEGMTAFRKKLEEQDAKVSFHWLLGRNDVAFYHPAANLSWLRVVRRLSKEQKWYSTYDLSLLINPLEDSLDFGKTPEEDHLLDRKVITGLEKKLNEFEAIYRKKHEYWGATPDVVWLRWLREAWVLVNSFIQNKLTLDLGTCLLPQFKDLFDYGTRLFASEKLRKEHLDGVHECFAAFFSNISILLDSMNHSSRQFIQVPSFHSVSFQMPPKIMAYYTAMIYRLIDVFHDDQATYGFTISPSFVKELDVLSLALKDVVEQDQFITISMSESSLYTLQQTTAIISHEISHFVGDKYRCREKRKETVLLCAIQGVLENLFWYFYQEIYGEDFDSREYPKVEVGVLRKCAKDIYIELLKSNPGHYTSEKYNYIEDLRILFADMSDDLTTDPIIYNKVLDMLWASFVTNGDENPEYLKYLQKHTELSRDGADRQKAGSGKEGILKKYVDMEQAFYVKNMMSLEYAKVLKKYPDILKNLTASREYESDPEPLEGFGHIEYMFRETYADIQMILLFGLSWRDYGDLLIKDRKKVAKDASPRMLAVAQALIQTKYWELEDVLNYEFTGASIKDVVNLNLESQSMDYIEKDIDPNLIYYLVDYLSVCKEKMEESFQDEKQGEKVRKLREIYGLLSGNTTVLELQRGMSDFISAYRKDLYKLI